MQPIIDNVFGNRALSYSWLTFFHHQTFLGVVTLWTSGAGLVNRLTMGMASSDCLHFEVVHEAVDQLQLKGLQGKLPLVSGQRLVGKVPQDECFNHPNVEDTPKQVFPPDDSVTLLHLHHHQRCWLQSCRCRVYRATCKP